MFQTKLSSLASLTLMSSICFTKKGLSEYKWIGENQKSQTMPCYVWCESNFQDAKRGLENLDIKWKYNCGFVHTLEIQKQVGKEVNRCGIGSINTNYILQFSCY